MAASWQHVKHASKRLLWASELPSSTSARPSCVADELPWCRSEAGRLPRDMVEAVGRFGCTLRRALHLGGLHGDDTNCRRRRGALLGWLRSFGRHMPVGLLHRNRCVESISWVHWPPLTAGWMVSLAYRSRSLWCKVVVERLPEADRSGLSGKPDAAELLPGLLMYVATDQAGCADAVITAVGVFCVSREVTRGRAAVQNPVPERVNYHRVVWCCGMRCRRLCATGGE